MSKIERKIENFGNVKSSEICENLIKRCLLWKVRNILTLEIPENP